MSEDDKKLLRAQLQAKEDGLNVRDRRIEALSAEIERLREALVKAARDIQSYKDAIALGGNDGQ